MRCAHGVYLPAWAVDGMNPYCSACGNFGHVVEEKNVILPRKNCALNDDRLRANEATGGCPECGSFIYVRVSETGTDSKRECAECGAKYTRKLDVHQQAVRLEEQLREIE